MRDYAKLAPTLWTGETGNALRARGFEGLLVGVYLVSSPMSNMLGLFAQPLLYMAHETGLGIDGARKGLQDCIDVGFCKYDERSQFVFVHEMAKWQISEALKPTDLRCKGIQKDYDALPGNAFLGEWFDRYAEAFNLTNRRSPSEGAYQAPSKPGTGTGTGTGTSSSQSSEEGTRARRASAPASPLAKKPARKPERPEDVTEQVWTDWCALRKAKRTTASATAVAGARAEAAKAGMTLDRFLAVWCTRGSQGLEASWLTPEERSGAPPPRNGHPTAADRRLATVRGLTTHSAAPSHDQRPEPPPDDNVVDVAARVVG